MTTFGPVHAGLMGNDDAWCDAVLAAGEATGERALAAPAATRIYADMIKGRYADIVNAVEGRKAHSITAAEFLHRFAGDVPWAHLDIAGVADDLGRAYAAKGASGWGVRCSRRLARTSRRSRPSGDCSRAASASAAAAEPRTERRQRRPAVAGRAGAAAAAVRVAGGRRPPAGDETCTTRSGRGRRGPRVGGVPGAVEHHDAAGPAGGRTSAACGATRPTRRGGVSAASSCCRGAHRPLAAGRARWPRRSGAPPRPGSPPARSSAATAARDVGARTAIAASAAGGSIMRPGPRRRAIGASADGPRPAEAVLGVATRGAGPPWRRRSSRPAVVIRACAPRPRLPRRAAPGPFTPALILCSRLGVLLPIRCDGRVAAGGRRPRAGRTGGPRRRPPGIGDHLRRAGGAPAAGVAATRGSPRERLSVLVADRGIRAVTTTTATRPARLRLAASRTSRPPPGASSDRARRCRAVTDVRGVLPRAAARRGRRVAASVQSSIAPA